MKKALALCTVLVVSLFTGCGKIDSKETKEVNSQSAESNVQTVVTVVAPKSPATIPILNMIESDCMGESTKIDLKLYSDMDTMMALASGDDYGIIVVPAHTAANLKNKGMDITLVNVFNGGGMYLSTTDPDCNSWKDLAGKELYVPAKGSVPDIITQYYLTQNSVNNVEIVYSNHAEIAQLLSAGTIKYAVDAQPFVTSNLKNVNNYKVIADFSEEWKNTQGEEYTMPGNCLVVNNKYLNENKELVDTFNKELSEAVELTLGNPTEAGVLASTYLNAKAELIAEAMPGFGFEYKSAVDAQKDIEQYYKVLLELKPEILGKKLPDKDFYYLAQ